MPSPFLAATTSSWYPEFLKPVAAAITTDTTVRNVLDIGTGPGTLPHLLIVKDPGLQLTGIDVSPGMINEARKRISHQNISFLIQKINAPLDFADNQFDAVSFCSVLFLLPHPVKTFLLNEAIRVLRPNGKIFILTPSGKKSILSSFVEVWRYPFSFNNWTFIVWKMATSGRGRLWQQQQWAEQYSKEKNYTYQSMLVFNNNATVEIITKLP